MKYTVNVIVNIEREKVTVLTPQGKRKVFMIDIEKMKERTSAINYISEFLNKSGILRFIKDYLQNNRVGVKIRGYMEDIYYLLYIRLSDKASRLRLATLGYNSL